MFANKISQFHDLSNMFKNIDLRPRGCDLHFVLSAKLTMAAAAVHCNIEMRNIEYFSFFGVCVCFGL